MGHRMKVQILTQDRVGHLQCYGVTVRGKVTSVYPPLHSAIALKKTVSSGVHIYKGCQDYK
jgi:hypothetical protein